MSNKTELQNNNTEFQSNNIDLQSILDTINTLPEPATLTASDDGNGNVTITMTNISGITVG